MITNATLSNVTAPPLSSAEGELVYGSGVSLSARCALFDVTRAQRISLAERISDAGSVLVVLKSDLPAGLSASLVPRARLAAAVDGSAARTYELIHVRDWEKAGGLSSFECFLKDVR